MRVILKKGIRILQRGTEERKKKEGENVCMRGCERGELYSVSKVEEKSNLPSLFFTLFFIFLII